MKRFILILYITLLGITVSAIDFHKADSLIMNAISERRTPGAALVVVTPDESIIHTYGHLSYEAKARRVDLNTQYDLASLSKVVGTGMAIFRLIEERRIELTAPVSRYLTDYSDSVTIADLLTHTSGFPAYVAYRLLIDSVSIEGSSEDNDQRKSILRRYIASCSHKGAEHVYRYSCLNFITLQYVVETVSGMTLDAYVEDSVFTPMGLFHSDYYAVPFVKVKSAGKIAYTETNIYPGVVHDPLAREMNAGVSGNAGVFSTAKDMSTFARWILYHPEGLMFRTSEDGRMVERNYAWACGESYTATKGNFTSPQTICHTGYTGTSIVIDPVKKMAVILLTNRVCPNDTASLGTLRADVADALYSQIDENHNVTE